MGKQNPTWTRPEVLLALDFYFRRKGNIPPRTSPAIAELSELIHQYSPVPMSLRKETFRNTSGVYMKLMNIRSLDPGFRGAGLPRGGVLEKEMWGEFVNNPRLCREEAEKIYNG